MKSKIYSYLQRPRILMATALLVIQLLLSTTLTAQLTGTKTIGTSGDYTSFAAAVTALNANGVGTGGVIFEFISNGGGNFTETITATQRINITTNAPTAVNTVTFRPANSVGTVTLTGSFSGDIIRLDNIADFISFDGRNGGTGTGKNMLIANTHVGVSIAISFVNGAASNKLQNIKCQSSTTNSSADGVISFNTSGAGPNTNNVIDNCEISGAGANLPAIGIYSVGSASPNNNTNNTVSNCLIYDYFLATAGSSGISLGLNNNAWTITGNRFYQTATRTNTAGATHRAINITTGSGYTITNNIIGYANSNGTGTYTMSGATNLSFKAITLNTATSTTSNVKGNIIDNISLTTWGGGTSSSGYFVGIEISGGNINVGGPTAAEGNTIGSTTSTGNITLSSTSSIGVIHGIVNNGTGTVNFQNNKIGGITSSPPPTGSGASSIVGIHISNTAGSGNILDNIIGSTTITDNIVNNSTAITGGGTTAGILLSTTTSSNISISNNVIANITNNHASSSTTAITRGIYTTGSMTGNLSITGNQVYNISTASVNNSTSVSGAVLAGIGCNNANVITITNNLVYNLSQIGGTTNVNIYGIYPNISNTNTNTVSRNLVYNLSSTSSGTAIGYGIRMTGTPSLGANTCANNVIRLGFNNSNAAITLAHTFYGLYDLTGSSNYLYNTVYIGGTGVTGGAKTFAMTTETNTSRTVQNNIFVNERSNTATNANKHYAYTAGAGGVLSSSYNIIFANGTDGIPIGRGVSTFTLTPYTSYKNYRVDFPSFEANSAFGNPQLSNPTAAIPDVSLALLSPAYQTGTPVAGITTDYANATRNATTPNIGAYETVSSTANSTTDIFTPTIAYTPLSSLYAVATGTRTITATIKDNGTGVPVTGSTVPRLYYKNNSVSSGTWQSVAGALTNGTGNNGTWDFSIDQDQLTLITGHEVVYYVVAQDQATTPNIWYNGLDATILHSNVNTLTTAPATPNRYIISGAMGGVYNIPDQFNSITKAGGLFNAINNATSITGNITINVTANLDEDGLYALSTWADGGNNYTLTIQPDAATLRTIQNAANILPNNTNMIRINTAVGVTIDGGAGKNLLFRNSNSVTGNTGSTIAISNTAGKLCTIQNVTVENNTTGATYGNIAILAGTNNVNINNNNIGDATAGGVATGGTRKAIYEAGGTANVVNIQNNNIYNFIDNGVILSTCANGAIISGNKFYHNLVVSATAIDVVSVNANSGHTIANNTIGGNNSTNTSTWAVTSGALLRGIFISGTASSLNNIHGNTIKNITSSHGLSLGFQGIVTGGSSMVNIDGLTIDNILIPASTTNLLMDGIRLGGMSSQVTNCTFNNMVTGVNNTGSIRIINLISSQTYTVSGCTISNITSRVASNNRFYAIANTNGGNATITNNTIKDITVANTGDFRCIFSSAINSISTITRNRIYNIASIGSGSVYGIFANNGDVTTAHNQISISNGANTNPVTLTGIYEILPTGKISNHYFNTVYIGGSQSSAANNSFCFSRETNSSVVNLRNNIFINERSSTGTSTGKHYVIGANNNTTWTSNYNLYVKGTTANNFVGLTNTTDQSLYADWKTNQTGEGNNSWNALATSGTSDFANINVGNLFVNLVNGNLDINTANAELWFVNGKGTQLTGFADDFGATGIRSVAVNSGGTDIGSDEFSPNTGVNPIGAQVTGTATNGATQNFIFAGRQIGSITWGAVGSVPALDVFYYSGINPINPTSGAQYFNAYWRIENTSAMSTTYDINLNYDDALIGTISSLSSAKVSKRPSLAGSNWVIEQTNSSTNTTTAVTSTTGQIYNSFSEFTGSSNISVLPLQLISFTGSRTNNANTLVWKTDNEINTKEFILERSSDAIQFTVVHTQPTTRSGNYGYTDNAAPAGKNYYRLKTVDNDGSYMYSPIILLNSSAISTVSIYPNPTTDVVTISSNGLINTNAVVSDMNGRVLQTIRITATTTTVNMSGYANGIYLLQLQNGETIKLIKQ
jgi:hypothetical protein